MTQIQSQGPIQYNNINNFVNNKCCKVTKEREITL